MKNQKIQYISFPQRLRGKGIFVSSSSPVNRVKQKIFSCELSQEIL